VRDARFLRDVADAGAVIALLREDSDRRVQDEAPLVFLAC
jgi:hypothetical protein